VVIVVGGAAVAACYFVVEHTKSGEWRQGGNPDIQADGRTFGRTGRQSKGSTKPTSRRGRWDRMGSNGMVGIWYGMVGMVWRHAYLKIIKQRQQQKETACQLFRFAGECEIVKLFKVYAAY